MTHPRQVAELSSCVFPFYGVGRLTQALVCSCVVAAQAIELRRAHAEHLQGYIVKSLDFDPSIFA